jgi:hypothetical protein
VPRTPITIRVTPAVTDRLAYLAMRIVPEGLDPTAALAARRTSAEQCGADVLDRWGRRRLDEPRTIAVIEHMATGRAEDAHESAERTVDLTVHLSPATVEALALDRFGHMDVPEFAAFLLGRWSDWYDTLARRPPLAKMNGVPE